MKESRIQAFYFLGGLMKELLSYQTQIVSGGLDGLSLGICALSGFSAWDYDKTKIYMTSFNGIAGMINGAFPTAEVVATLGLTPFSGAILGLVLGSGFGLLYGHYGYQLGQYMLMQYDQPQGI